MDANTGRRNEAVFEYTPEPATASARPGVVAKGSTIAGRAAAAVSPALRDNETIDTSAVNVAQARELFTNKEADAEEAEAEARLHQPRGASQRGRPALKQTPAAAHGAAVVEAVDQRYARLQTEVASMIRIAEQSPPDVAAALLGGNPDSILAELRAMEQKLRSWRKGSGRNVLGQGSGEAAAGQGSKATSVTDQLDRLVAMAGATGAASSTPVDRMTWEINYMPSVETVANGSRLAALESSLAQMTATVGTLDSAIVAADLQNAMSQVHARLSLLDSQKLEALRAGAEKANLGLEACLARKEELRASHDAKTNSEVAELYNHCHRFTSAAAALPSIVMRLQSLQSMHHLNASFVARLSALELQQEELTKVLEVTNSAVKEMQVGMKENMAVMQANLAALEAKLSRGRAA